MHGMDDATEPPKRLGARHKSEHGKFGRGSEAVARWAAYRLAERGEDVE